jgi:hypothetical protein
MAKLNAAARKAIPKRDFALPGGRYPIEDASHARNALARVAQHGSPSEKSEVKRKVRAKYPDIGQNVSSAKRGKKWKQPDSWK